MDFKNLTKRIDPFDGMSVNARVWQDAHEYHRQQQRAHNLLHHGPGIVTGLEVYAEQPATRRVWIQPGVAIDAQGEVVVIPEKSSYFIKPGEEGVIHLLLEGREVSGFGAPAETTGKTPRYVQTGFVTKTSATLSPNAIELARFRMWGAEAAVVNPRNGEDPKQNEIDMRYRRDLRATTARLAVAYFGDKRDKSAGMGLSYLVRSLNQTAANRVSFDDDVNLQSDLSAYTMLYLVEQGEGSNPNPTELSMLRNYLQQGGLIFAETMTLRVTDSPLFNALNSPTFNLRLAQLTADHPMLFEPFLFAAPPSGFEANGTLLVSDGGLIFSTYNYGRLWQRTRRDGRPPTREELRAALEWGQNLVTYATKYYHKTHANGLLK